MISSVRPFFRTRLEGLGYTEHVDAVDFSNIPKTLLDDSFQMETNNITSGPANQLAHDFDYGIVIRVFKRGFGNPVEAYDEADQTIETILSDILNVSNRLGSEIKDIVPVSIDKIPLSASVDNDIILEFSFVVKLLMCFG